MRIDTAVVILAVAALSGAAGCGRSGERQDHLACISPDGSKTALFYREFGGGAAGWQTELVSVATRDRPKTVFEMTHGYDVVLEWVSSDTLKLHYPQEASVFKTVNDTKLADGSRLNVEFIQKRSKAGSFVNDKTRCVGGSVGVIDSEPRPLR